MNELYFCGNHELSIVYDRTCAELYFKQGAVDSKEMIRMVETGELEPHEEFLVDFSTKKLLAETKKTLREMFHELSKVKMAEEGNNLLSSIPYGDTLWREYYKANKTVPAVKEEEAVEVTEDAD